MAAAEPTPTGVVRVWHADAGWGVIDSAATPGGCWSHYSVVSMAGYRALEAGQQVSLVAETPGQDGYDYRAVTVTPIA